ncbi:hypothetical protein A2716_00655 [candidate division WWE3 bacterium RIFCSPHIGHO2_01_FULL_40_23]|uniref:Uncharacterized protein n=1 Tax=candidate division WWE3 bacterium RIFCSPLOWO2_01_FULL_41_18 TaxID=1802625 RepID=A0A1F4VEB4_UNCKA|nr:MAG: hypothetical protein A2716_00655 [candidate division WWE3 bacterium RIFCSPHIGHO2_01_FULL_40_23]OGC55504.1 MAG: hypothetical protein A3A78_00925 [candidate division WWE3 bacterium RIFCSPLOWO2_01_FULL_41_18]
MAYYYTREVENMSIKLKIVSFGLLLSSLFLVSGKAHALIGEDLLEKRCTSIEARIQNRITRYDSLKDMHLKRYQNLREKVARIITSLEAKGLDVTKLKTDLEMLDAKIKKAQDDYAAFIAKLKETKDLSCGSSEGEFKAKLDEARALLKTFREDLEDIRNFYKTTIKADVLELRRKT